MILGIATWISVLLAFVFALLHLSLALGAPFGEYVLGGVHKVLPNKMRSISGGFLFIFTMVGLLYLQKSEIINAIFNTVLTNVLLIVYTLSLAYAIIGNWFLTKSKKEKYVMTPLSVIGFISSLIVLIWS